MTFVVDQLLSVVQGHCECYVEDLVVSLYEKADMTGGVGITMRLFSTNNGSIKDIFYRPTPAKPTIVS